VDLSRFNRYLAVDAAGEINRFLSLRIESRRAEFGEIDFELAGGVVHGTADDLMIDQSLFVGFMHDEYSCVGQKSGARSRQPGARNLGCYLRNALKYWLVDGVVKMPGSGARTLKWGDRNHQRCARVLVEELRGDVASQCDELLFIE
jgi:hypothetical protein